MIRTFETRLDLRYADKAPLDEVLHAYAALMSTAERKLLAKLEAGREWQGDLHVNLYGPLGITSVHLNMLHRQILGKLSSIRELAKADVKDTEAKIKSKKTDIKRKAKSLDKARKHRNRHEAKVAKHSARVASLKARLHAAPEGGDLWHTLRAALKVVLDTMHADNAALRKYRASIKALEPSLHQHQRKLDSLGHRLAEARERASTPSICYGTRKLFNEQHHLEANGYASHEEWLADWRAARSNAFKLDGNALKESGNEFARLTERKDGLFDLELRLPPKLAHLGVAGKYGVSAVSFKGLSFNHGTDVIREALAAEQPVTVMFRNDGKSWKVHVTVDQPVASKRFDDSLGCIGIDVNVGFLSVTRVDRFGNPVESFDVPFDTHGKTSAQSLDAARKAALVICRYAKRHGLPIVVENLDFSDKKRELNRSSVRYARMLSSFAYASIRAALESACARNGMGIRRVNPAYTSIIGRVKFARRYGESVHRSAALCIARRAMRFSESVPVASDGTVSVPSDNGSVVTFPAPARKPGKHVWSMWNGINSEWKSSSAMSMPPGRKPRPFASPTGSTPVGDSGRGGTGHRPAASRGSKGTFPGSRGSTAKRVHRAGGRVASDEEKSTLNAQ